jgi:hypothetical protein
VAGQPAYLWAHVANTGDIEARGVRIDFYWANPALQVMRSTATRVGSAFADLAAQGEQDVLCLVPWSPIIVNGGHECLVAVANHPADPLPNPLPDAFDPPNFRQVAQKNLTVLTVGLKAVFVVITVGAVRRADKTVLVRADLGQPLDTDSLGRLGIKDLQPAQDAVEVGLGLQPVCPGSNDPLGAKELELNISRGKSVGVYAMIRAPRLLKGEYQVVNITERSGSRILGGFCLVVLSDK